MSEETIFKSSSSVSRAWNLISDLSNYKSWHPDYSIVGKAISGTSFDLSWMIFHDRRMDVSMMVNRVEKPRVLEWSGGFNWLFFIKERYEILPLANGVEIHHFFECGGLAGRALGSIRQSGIRAAMAAQDAALLLQLRKQVRKAPSGAGVMRRFGSNVVNRKADNG